MLSDKLIDRLSLVLLSLIMAGTFVIVFIQFSTDVIHRQFILPDGRQDSMFVRFRIDVPVGGKQIMISRHYRNVRPSGRYFVADTMIAQPVESLPVTTEAAEQFVRDVTTYETYSEFRRDRGDQYVVR